jgi:diguanylate cyclase (GGDEF)-like protein/PAS domain S-box-containing protein
VQHLLDDILKIDILCAPDEYLRRVLGILCAGLPGACAVAFIVDADDQFVFAAEHDLPEPLLAFCTSGGYLPRVPGAPSPAVDPAPFGAALAQAGFVAITQVPLIHQGRLLGLVELYFEYAAPLPAEVITLLGRLGELVAIAIASNASLDQLDQRTRELHEEIALRERVEQALRRALQERRALVEIINHSTVVALLCRAEPGWPVEFVSDNVAQFGYNPQEILSGSLPLSTLIHPEDRPKVEAAWKELLTAPDVRTLEYRLLPRQGPPRWVEHRIWTRRDSDGLDLLPVVTAPRGVVTHLQGILHDITERKQTEALIYHQAYHDTLTGLPNRTLFQDRLEQAIHRAQRRARLLAVCFLDLDRFKAVNDTLGHHIGDRLLQGVASRLRAVLRTEDTISRLGGDEFTLLLPEIKDPDDAAAVANKVCSAITQPFTIEGQQVHVGTSIGISLFPDDGADARTLLQCADTALYHAKDRGGNTFSFFMPGMNAKLRDRLELEGALRTAIDDDQLLLHYQPQVDLVTGQVSGFEALVRWQHPEWGLLAPDRFIPLAEENGLIVPLGQWVLQEACQQARSWQDHYGMPVRMSVNLSPRQFHQHDLVSTVEEALAATGLPSASLTLEITEGVAMRDVDYSVQTMRMLKGMQVGLSMDDFGVGYSSLMCLKHFPIDTLKIDHSFVQGLLTDSNDAAITHAIIAMADSLRLAVIAEGVETQEQLAFLRASGCNNIQGYLISRPLPAQECSRFVARRGTGVLVGSAPGGGA